MWLINILFSMFFLICDVQCFVDPKKFVVWGPGLNPHNIVLPARYFFIRTVDSQGNPLTKSPGNNFTVNIAGVSQYSNNCRRRLDVLDRKDGTFIVRYRLYEECQNMVLHIKYNLVDVANSPYVITDPVYPEECYCPEQNFQKWQKQYECKNTYRQIEEDLKQFKSVNFSLVQEKILSSFNNPRSTSICHYAVKDNKIYRNCYGQYVGFKMFVDAILLSLSRKVKIPDLEMFVNLGDWPLIKINEDMKLPMFSWCGSDDTMDIVMPTYDITESTLENMGRVSLDMLSVQGNIEKEWDTKIEKAFWRGRDSRRERLLLIQIARQNPDLINASLTNFFFFKDEMDKYGPKEDHISFFKFFDYKYQVNIDGSVAAHRFPYLLAGDSLVLKQDSKYYEHFYKDLLPGTHYIPFKRDLSDFILRIKWAKKNDISAKSVATAARKFAEENLMPQHIICYYAVLLKEWSKRLISPVKITDGMELVEPPRTQLPQEPCKCHLHHENSHYRSREDL